MFFVSDGYLVAQKASTNIFGGVSDSNKSVIADANIPAIHPDIKASRSVKTNPDGAESKEITNLSLVKRSVSALLATISVGQSTNSVMSGFSQEVFVIDGGAGSKCSKL